MHGLFASFCHFLRKGLFAVLADVSDAGGTVATEDKSKYLADEIVVETTFLHIHLTFSTGTDVFSLATLADLAP